VEIRADVAPARVLPGVVAIDDHRRDVLERRDLVPVAGRRGLDRDQRLYLVGTRLRDLEAK